MPGKPQDPRLVRWQLRRASRAGVKAAILYLDSLRLVTPLSVTRELLTAQDEDAGGRVRKFRMEFIREVSVRESALGRPREMEQPRRFELHLPASLLAEIDEKRGDTPRAAWIRQAIEQRLHP